MAYKNYNDFLMAEGRRWYTRAINASDAYQETGTPRYYSEAVKADYYQQALSDALELIKSRDAANGGVRRKFAGLLREFRDRRGTLSKAELLDWVEGELWRESL